MNASTHLHGENGPSALARLAHLAGLEEAAIVVRPCSPLSDRTTPFAGGAELDAAAPIYPASMIKLPLAAAVTGLWDAGVLSRDAEAIVTAANMTANDAASPLVPGYATRLDLAVHLMLSRSDNVATNVLIDVAGRDRATAYVRSLGLTETAIRRKLSGSEPLIDDPAATGRNAHTARDAAELLGLIAGRTIPGAEWLHAALANQVWNDKLSPGLRPGDRFAHKTGETDEVSHDGGILDLDDGARYVIVVYTRLGASRRTDEHFAEFMRLLRPAL